MAVINVGSLTDWRLLESGKNLDMPGGKRSVRLSIVSPERAAVTVADLSTGQLMCVGAVEGMETFLFAVEGDCQVSVTTDSDVFFKTDDGAVTSVAFDNEPFVTMMERTPRNPQMEYMMYVQEQNARRRENQMIEAMEARLARQERNSDGQVNSGATSGNSSAPVAGTDANPVGGTPVAKPAGGTVATDAAVQEPAASPSGDPK